ncbi:MAG: hypothetical protein QOK04_2380 [Solirubrobacteraceae bacterium]|jgi:carbon monoxide dehydrogenase subunit G|nr:hypothetical protein [Solirubrobacteraceae bacterium]
MPVTRRTQTLRAAPDDVWAVIADPHHLPRWWPRVRRVEDVGHDHWTKVMATEKGRLVRADERLLISERPRRRRWTQDLEDSPFERLLSEVSTGVELEPDPAGTRVTLELAQRLRGINRLGGFMVRRASRRLLDEALDGLGVACER